VNDEDGSCDIMLQQPQHGWWCARAEWKSVLSGVPRRCLHVADLWQHQLHDIRLSSIIRWTVQHPPENTQLRQR